jgi:hypothetical protein
MSVFAGTVRAGDGGRQHGCRDGGDGDAWCTDLWNDPYTAPADLKQDGQHEWLTSRLYLFAYVLSRMKGVRCVVFTVTRGDVGRFFLGVAGIEGLLHALTTAQPWLQVATWRAEAAVLSMATPAWPSQPPQPIAPPADAGLPGSNEWWQYVDPLYFSEQFLQEVQLAQPPGAADQQADWLKLPDIQNRLTTWEHASWLTASDLIDGALRDAVRPDAYVVDNHAWPADERIRTVAQARSDFVALVSPDRRFERLVDRRSLLDALGEVALRP